MMATSLPSPRLIDEFAVAARDPLPIILSLGSCLAGASRDIK